MSPREAERQELLSWSCPKNIGNFRQLTWYCRQVPQSLVPDGGARRYSVCTSSKIACPAGRLFFILKLFLFFPKCFCAAKSASSECAKANEFLALTLYFRA